MTKYYSTGIELEILDRTEFFMDCKINGKFHQMRKEISISQAPYYEPFFGWYVAEGWQGMHGDPTLLIIHYKVGGVKAVAPEREVDYSRCNGMDVYEWKKMRL